MLFFSWCNLTLKVSPRSWLIFFLTQVRWSLYFYSNSCLINLKGFYEGWTLPGSVPLFPFTCPTHLVKGQELLVKEFNQWHFRVWISTISRDVLADIWHYVGAFDKSLGSAFSVTLSYCFSDSDCIFFKLVPAVWKPVDLLMLPYSAWWRAFGAWSFWALWGASGPCPFISPGIDPMWCIALSFAEHFILAWWIMRPCGFCRICCKSNSWVCQLSEQSNICLHAVFHEIYVYSQCLHARYTISYTVCWWKT